MRPCKPFEDSDWDLNVSDYCTTAEPMLVTQSNYAQRLKNKRNTEVTAVTYENAKILENVKNQLLNKFDESYTHNRYLFPEDGSRVEQSGFSHQSNTKFNMKNLYIREASRVHTPFIVNAKIA
jgi:predicted HNH restriction endonuclease